MKPRVSKQVNDARVFAGIWNYLSIGTWGAGTDEFASDLVIDAVTQAVSGRVIVTGSMFADCAVRWPARVDGQDPTDFFIFCECQSPRRAPRPNDRLCLFNRRAKTPLNRQCAKI
jgi:hypothetical protein